MSDGEIYWFATKNAPPGETSADERQTVLQLFRNWHAPIADLIAATPREAVLRNDIFDRPRARTWTRGRVTLLGDAAHPMTPNLGQGGCQALEDAVILARALQQTPQIQNAWKLYESNRMSRTAMITIASRRVGAMGQWENGMGIVIRDRLVAWLGRLQVKQIVSLVSYDAGRVALK
jgi:2-polyprenyl-6-methoxyphenol hydroxylase-like FAD-dependent oxidoreductase